MESHATSTAASKELRWPSQQFIQVQCVGTKSEVWFICRRLPTLQLPAYCKCWHELGSEVEIRDSIMKHLRLFLFAVVLVQMYLHYIFCSALSFQCLWKLIITGKISFLFKYVSLIRPPVPLHSWISSGITQWVFLHCPQWMGLSSGCCGLMEP